MIFLPEIWINSGAEDVDLILKELLKQDDPVYVQSRYNLRPQFITYCRKTKFQKGGKFTYSGCKKFKEVKNGVARAELKKMGRIRKVERY